MLAIIRIGMERRKHAESTAYICAIASILNFVDALDFLSQKDYLELESINWKKCMVWYIRSNLIVWDSSGWKKKKCGGKLQVSLKP